MARINLLPWREERRQDLNKEFGVLMGIAALVGGAVFFGLMSFFNDRIENQEQRNTKLNQEIAVLDRRIREIEELERRREQLLTRKSIIEQLQQSRSQTVHLFDEMARTIPDGVRMTGMSQQGPVVTLKGAAESNAKVSAYMDSLENSEWMRNTALRFSREPDQRQNAIPERFEFELNVAVGPEPQEDGADQGAGE